MTETIAQLGMLAAAPVSGEGAGVSPLAALIPILPLLGVVLSAACAVFRVKSKLPAWLSVLCLGGSFVLTLRMFVQTAGQGHPVVIHAFEWINFQWGARPEQSLIGNFSFYVDSLTCLWMLFVTGLGALIALYASEYMAGDVGPGYCRFFAAFNLFVFSMACLVMGDNLLLLYLGWEGVGLCSYLLIGYFYKKPSAVAAAKKAFIVNRIGDLGLALGVWLTFVQFGTVEYARLFPAIEPSLALAREGRFDQIPFFIQLIPILFTIGAFGKSAQLFLYVWLPDAMEGPTPVSALIHAATMVTAGVYLVARFFPFYLSSEYALPIVAWSGAITALWSATIGMAQFDIKRIMAYSTVSQLGYMFAGLGVLGSVGAASHVFTHAFFKALLFLACGAVMHGFAGQLDLRKLSGVGRMPGWRIVSLTMLVGCINLAGVPLITSGFWSKDIIIADAFANAHLAVVGWILLVTAGLTAYYTFRVYFRVFAGPVEYEPGEEIQHGEHSDHRDGHAGHGADVHSAGQSPAPAHEFHPHAPGWAINLVLIVLSLCSFGAIGLFFVDGEHGWVGGMVHDSTAGVEVGHQEHATFFGFDPHQVMYWVSGVVGLAGIAIAYYLHLAGRTGAARARADNLLPALGPIPRWAQHKWYVDEFYNFLLVSPLWVIAHLCHLIDKFLVDGLVDAFGWAPRGLGRAARTSQTGVIHYYALRMLGGLVILIAIVVFVGMESGGPSHERGGGAHDTSRTGAPIGGVSP